MTEQPPAVVTPFVIYVNGIRFERYAVGPKGDWKTVLDDVLGQYHQMRGLVQGQFVKYVGAPDYKGQDTSAPNFSVYIVETTRNFPVTVKVLQLRDVQREEVAKNGRGVGRRRIRRR